jgi:hypothetical protein
VAPVRPQDVRPKDLLYWEAKGPTLYMGTWAQAIARADWAQVVTWNDYAEGSQVEPSVGTGWAYAKLTAYYAAWFHAGAAPAIARDDLYYFQRTQRADAPVASGAQSAPFRLLGGTPADDHAWALGFLTAPGTLRVACGAEVWQAGVGAGVQLFPAPGVIGGCAPDYQLVRSGSTVRRLTGPTIAGAVTRQDPLYHAATTAP